MTTGTEIDVEKLREALTLLRASPEHARLPEDLRRRAEQVEQQIVAMRQFALDLCDWLKRSGIPNPCNPYLCLPCLTGNVLGKREGEA